MYRFGAIVALAMGMLFMASAYQLFSSGSASLGEFTQPGPGTWPLLVSGVMVASSVIVLLTERGEDVEAFTGRIKLIGLGFASLALFVVLFPYLGFILPGFLTLAFWLRYLGGESWRMTLLLSVLLTAILYVLFVPLLGVPFPEDAVSLLWGGD